MRFLFAIFVSLVLATSAHAQTRCSVSPDGRIESCSSGLPQDTLRRIQMRQQASNWCWAATVSMILRHYGIEVPQERIVFENFGMVVDEGATDQEILAMLNRRWTDKSGKSVALYASMHQKAALSRSLHSPAVIADLDAGRPLVLGYKWHAVLLVGIHYERARSNPTADPRTTVHAITVIDPIYVQSRLTLRVASVEPQLLARVSLDSEDAQAPGPADTRMAYLPRRYTRRLSCDMSGECFRNPALAPVEVARAAPARQ